MRNHRLHSMTLALLAALALAACGGGSDDADVVVDEPGEVPTSATASAMAFSTYVAGLPASDSAEPLALAGLVPPVSDTDEPIALR